MAIGAILTSAYGVGKTLGIDLGGIFGGGPDPNFSTNSLRDTINNYEGVNASQAALAAPEMVKAAAGGASDAELARILVKYSNYNSTAGITTSKKWPLIKGQLRPMVARYKRELRRGDSTTTPGMMSVANGNSGANIFLWIIGAGALLAWYAWTQRNK